jgi:hypothetical protein
LSTDVFVELVVVLRPEFSEGWIFFEVFIGSFFSHLGTAVRDSATRRGPGRRQTRTGLARRGRSVESSGIHLLVLFSLIVIPTDTLPRTIKRNRRVEVLRNRMIGGSEGRRRGVGIVRIVRTRECAIKIESEVEFDGMYRWK